MIEKYWVKERQKRNKMKKELVIKCKGKKEFVSYGEVIGGEISAGKYKMLTVNADFFENNPKLKEAYKQAKSILDSALDRMFDVKEEE